MLSTHKLGPGGCAGIAPDEAARQRSTARQGQNPPLVGRNTTLLPECHSSAILENSTLPFGSHLSSFRRDSEAADSCNHAGTALMAAGHNCLEPPTRGRQAARRPWLDPMSRTVVPRLGRQGFTGRFSSRISFRVCLSVLCWRVCRSRTRRWLFPIHFCHEPLTGPREAGGTLLWITAAICHRARQAPGSSRSSPDSGIKHARVEGLVEAAGQNEHNGASSSGTCGVSRVENTQ